MSPIRFQKLGLGTLVILTVVLYLGALWMMQTHAHGDFWPGFYGNLMATLAGVIIGIPAGLWLNRQVEARESEGERRSDLEQVGRWLAYLRSCAESNLYLMEGIPDPEGRLFYNRLEYRVWSTLAPTLVAKIGPLGQDGIDVASALSAYFTSMETLQTFLDQQFTLHHGVERTLPGYENLRQDLGLSIETNAKRLEQATPGLLESLDEVNTRIGSLVAGRSMT